MRACGTSLRFRKVKKSADDGPFVSISSDASYEKIKGWFHL